MFSSKSKVWVGVWVGHMQKWWWRWSESGQILHSKLILYRTFAESQRDGLSWRPDAPGIGSSGSQWGYAHISLLNHWHRVLFWVPLELFLSTTSRSRSFTHPKHANSEDFESYAVENKFHSWNIADRGLTPNVTKLDNYLRPLLSIF